MSVDTGKPSQNGCNESFNGTFRCECLNAEFFVGLTDTRVLIEEWLQQYNCARPHNSEGYITPEMAYFRLHKIRKT